MTRHMNYVDWIFLNVFSWVMTLSTVVTTNVVEKYTEFPENGGSTFLQNVGNHNRLQDAIIVDTTTQFFTAVKSIHIYTHIQYLSGAENCYDSLLLVFSTVYLLLILTSFKTTSPSLSLAEGSSLKRQYLLRSRRALHSPTGCHVYTSGHSRKEGL